MELRVNGKPRASREGLTVTGLLADLQIQPQRVAVQLNGEILRREQFPEVVLKDGDTVLTETREIMAYLDQRYGVEGASREAIDDGKDFPSCSL